MTISWHFPEDSVTFLRELEANNNRDWFAENKARYEVAFKQSAEDFIDQMTPKLDALVGVEHDSKLFRIFRDVRFSKDKTPYNTHIHISFFQKDSAKNTAHWFFGLEPDRVVIGVGEFAFAKEKLEPYRLRVAGEQGAALQKTLNSLLKKGATLHEPELKRVPKGFDADHPRADLLRRKGLAIWKTLGDAEIATHAGLISECGKAFRQIKPLYDWLNG